MYSLFEQVINSANNLFAMFGTVRNLNVLPSGERRGCSQPEGFAQLGTSGLFAT
jgi:hypothetical protein